MTLFPEADSWRAGMQDVAQAIEDEMGELVTVTPVQPGKPNFPGISQPQLAVTANAVFTARAKLLPMGPGRMRGDFSISPLISTREPVFQFRFGALPWRIEQGFQIFLHRTRETFAVIDVQSDGVSSFIVKVTQLERAKDDTVARVEPEDDPRIPRIDYR